MITAEEATFGESNTVSAGALADTGEYIPIQCIVAQSGTNSTTSTSYVSVYGGSGAKPPVTLPSLPTNGETYSMRIVADLDGAPRTFRFGTGNKYGSLQNSTEWSSTQGREILDLPWFDISARQHEPIIEIKSDDGNSAYYQGVMIQYGVRVV